MLLLLISYLEASEPKLANFVINIIGVDSLRLGGLHFTSIYYMFWIILKKDEFLLL